MMDFAGLPNLITWYFLNEVQKVKVRERKDTLLMILATEERNNRDFGL